MPEPIVSFDPRRHGVDDPAEIAAVAAETGLTAIEWPVVSGEDLLAIPQFETPLRLVTLRVLRNDVRHADDVAFIGSAIDAAAERGCRLVAGPAGDPQPGPARVSAVDRLRRIADWAAARGVVYALESGPGLCASHRTMLDTLQELTGHAAVGLSFDPVLLHACNDYYFNSEVALAKVCHRVVHVRAADCSGDPGDPQCVPLGTGAIDFVRMGELLRVCAFEGPYCVSLPSDVRTASRLIRSLQAAAAELRRCRVIRG